MSCLVTVSQAFYRKNRIIAQSEPKNLSRNARDEPKKKSSMRNQHITKKVSRATLRPYILLTLSHAEAENRASVNCKVIVERITEVLRCSALIVAKEKHQAEGFHFHIGIESTNASRNTATRLLRDTFPEFDGAQCSVKFHKSWATICAYVTKEDNKPLLWGQYTMDQIKQKADVVRRHRRASYQNHDQPDEIYTRLKASKQWLDVYKDPILREANLKKYQNRKQIFLDLKTIEQLERDPLQALSIYLKQKGYPEEYDIEYLKEKYLALDWLAINLVFPRSLKAKQLCIQGKPSSQKSLLFKLIAEVIETYFAGTRMNDFTDAHDFFDLWVIDEFKEPVKDSFSNSLTEAGQVYLNTLLRLLDGQECKLDAKYQSVFTKKVNVPIICATNVLGPELKGVGPLNERFIFTSFNTRIQELQPERILATLYGCIIRRVEYRCKIAGYSPEEQKRIIDSPENIRRIMRENQFEIRYNELEVQIPVEQIIKDTEVLHLVFSPQNDKKKGIYAYIEANRCNRAQKFNPDEIKPEMEQQVGPLQINNIYTKGLSALNKNKIGLLEVARIPLKKRSFKRRKENQEEEKGPEAVKAYFLTKNEYLMVYRNRSTQQEDYASWPIKIEVEVEEEGYYTNTFVKANFRIRSRKEQKEARRIEENHSKEDSAERKEAFFRAKLKLGIET